MTANVVLVMKRNIKWTKNDEKRNLEVFIGNSGVKVFRNDSQSMLYCK